MPAGRPRINIDKNQFEKLCGIQCTQEEIAGFFSCSTDTIERWCEREYDQKFAEVFRQKRGLGRISLRRSQFRMAEHSASMAIWLGKQYLDQKDHIEYKDTSALDKLDGILKEMNIRAVSDGTVAADANDTAED